MPLCSVADLAIKCGTHSGSKGGRKIRRRAYPKPIPTGFHAYRGPDFLPRQVRLCVPGFMARSAPSTHSHPSGQQVGGQGRMGPCRRPARWGSTGPCSLDTHHSRKFLLSGSSEYILVRLRCTPRPRACRLDKHASTDRVGDTGLALPERTSENSVPAKFAFWVFSEVRAASAQHL
jgi:hypothetical protein